MRDRDRLTNIEIAPGGAALIRRARLLQPCCPLLSLPRVPSPIVMPAHDAHRHCPGRGHHRPRTPRRGNVTDRSRMALLRTDGLSWPVCGVPEFCSSRNAGPTDRCGGTPREVDQQSERPKETMLVTLPSPSCRFRTSPSCLEMHKTSPTNCFAGFGAGYSHGKSILRPALRVGRTSENLRRVWWVKWALLIGVKGESAGFPKQRLCFLNLDLSTKPKPCAINALYAPNASLMPWTSASSSEYGVARPSASAVPC